MTIISIPQVDGGARWMALADDDARIVRADPPMIDHVSPLAIVDTYEDGHREILRGVPGGRAVRAIVAELDESPTH